MGQAQLASLNESKAVSAMLQARRIAKVRDQLQEDEGKASTLLRDADREGALSLYQQILSTYKSIGDTAGQKRTQGNIETLQKQVKDE